MMRPALRSLLHAPGFTAISLVTLALGIGVTTSMFSVLDALLFRSAPFPDAQRLVQIFAQTRTGETEVFSAIELGEINGQSTDLAARTMVARRSYAVSLPGEPAERISGVAVSAGFDATFATPPLLGRTFRPEEHQPGRDQVVLLSHGYWQQRYGGEPTVIGRTLRLDGEPVTVIGVMPPHFDYRQLWGDAAFWRPLTFTKDQQIWRDYRAFVLFGRLAPEATPTQVSAQLAPLAAVQEQSHPESYAGLRYRVLPLHEALMDDVGRRLSWMLLALAGFVLLIACANLANLQLARATRQVRELAIRAALGASRRRLIQQQLGESLLLALGGGTLGLLLAVGLNRMIDRNVLIAGTAGTLEIGLNLTILVLTLLVALGTGLLFGLLPAWFATQVDINQALKQQTRGGSAGRGQHRIRQALIVGEVALALVLLGGAAVLHRGFARLLEREAGWDTDQILTATLPVPESRIDSDAERIELFRKLEDRLRLLPGVEHAALTTSLPVFNYTGARQILTEGQTPGDPSLPNAFHVMVSADYFAALGVPLVAGSLFPPDVKADDRRVIVINEALARRLWPGRSALGQRLGSMDSGQAYWAEVIGVVRDVDTAASLRDPSTPFQVYKPLVHEPWSFINLVLRSPAPGSLRESLRRAVAEVDADLAPAQIGTVRQLVDQQQHNLVVAAKTLTGFAALGLLLAAIGLYGVISQLVTQRTGEFGIRLALGAQPQDLLRLVLVHGLMLTVLGTVAGLFGAVALARFMGSLMPRVGGLDPLALAGVVGLLMAVALFACWVPARRATRVDPMIALRAE